VPGAEGGTGGSVSPLVLERTLRDCDPRMVLDDDLSFSNLWRRLLNLKEELGREKGSSAGEGKGGKGGGVRCRAPLPRVGLTPLSCIFCLRCVC
jgi:hypothetical protein